VFDLDLLIPANKKSYHKADKKWKMRMQGENASLYKIFRSR
jgi:hypothetical protein